MEKQLYAMISGVSGQDGSLLAELLLSKGYEVYGLMRENSSKENLENIINNPNFHLIQGDLLNNDLISFLIKTYKFDEIYNLASQSNIRLSYTNPLHTFNVTLMGTLVLLENIKKYSPDSKMFQAGSSAMFGKEFDSDGKQRETTLMKPISPYASSKLFAHNICCNYRSNENLFISNGILYNHESPKTKTLLGVTNKIIRHASEIKKGLKYEFEIPDLGIYIDLGHAEDYVEAIWLTLQQLTSDDYIISSGRFLYLDYICDLVFNKFGLNYKEYIKTSLPIQYQVPIVGDSSRLKLNTGWKPKHTINDLIDEIIYKNKLIW